MVTACTIGKHPSLLSKEKTKSIIFSLYTHTQSIYLGVCIGCVDDLLMLRFLPLFFALLHYFPQQHALATVTGLYAYEKENVWLLMADGVRLSVTLTSPIAAQPNEKFPVLVEYKPYRKDDSSFNAGQATVIYLARRGFIVSANAGS